MRVLEVARPENAEILTKYAPDPVFSCSYEADDYKSMDA